MIYHSKGAMGPLQEWEEKRSRETILETIAVILSRNYLGRAVAVSGQTQDII